MILGDRSLSGLGGPFTAIKKAVATPQGKAVMAAAAQQAAEELGIEAPGGGKPKAPPLALWLGAGGVTLLGLWKRSILLSLLGVGGLGVGVYRKLKKA